MAFASSGRNSFIDVREAAEAVIDHKEKLGSYHHSVYYIQEYVNKPGRDIRVFVVGDKVVGAIYRYSKHWMTNIENNQTIEKCELTNEIRELALAATKAVKGEIVAVDMLEKGYKILVNEINYTVEFSKILSLFDKNIVNEIIDHVERKYSEVQQ